MGNNQSHVTPSQAAPGSPNIARAPASVPNVPDDPQPSPNLLPFVLAAVGLIGVVGLIAIIWSSAPNRAAAPLGPKPAPAKKAAWKPETADDRVVDRFVKLHNAGDKAALDLLGGEAKMPAGQITEKEAYRLDAEYYLRDPDLSFEGIRPNPRGGAAAYILDAKGNVAGPRYKDVLTKRGVEEHQGTMYMPDLHIVVRDGKIYGVDATLHRD